MKIPTRKKNIFLVPGERYKINNRSFVLVCENLVAVSSEFHTFQLQVNAGFPTWHISNQPE